MKKTMINRVLIALIFAFTTISSHAIDLGAWLGYGITLNRSYGAVCAEANNHGVACTRGGFSFGGDVWFSDLGPFELGLGLAYIPIIDASYSFTRTDLDLGITSVSAETKVTNVPFMAQLRYDIPALPIFVGGMAGYSFAFGSSTYKTTINNIPVTPFTGGVGSVPVDGSFTLGGFAGYAFKPVSAPLVSIDAGARLYLILGYGMLVQFVPFIGATFAI